MHRRQNVWFKLSIVNRSCDVVGGVDPRMLEVEVGGRIKEEMANCANSDIEVTPESH